MISKAEENSVNKLLEMEEFKAENIIALIRIALYLFFTLLAVWQVITMDLPFENEVLPLIIATVFAAAVYIKLHFFGLKFIKLPFMNNFQTYYIVTMDVVMFTYLTYLGLVNAGGYEAFRDMGELFVIMPFLAFAMMGIIFMVLDIFRFSVGTTIYLTILMVTAYLVIALLLQSNPLYFGLLEISHWSFALTVSYVIFILIVGGLCLLLSKQLRKILIKTKRQERLERFLPESAVKELIDKGQDIGVKGSKTETTILFADIRNFSTMSEGKEPEYIVEFLNEFFDMLINCVFEHKGTLDKIIGDGIMAIYGAPLYSEEAAENALKSAIAMQRKIEEYNKERAEKGLEPVRIGIGIHTGDVVIGAVGAEKRMDFTAIGETVNIASRLEGLTKEFSRPILLSAATKEKITGRYEFENLGRVSVKGHTREVEVLGVAV